MNNKLNDIYYNVTSSAAFTGKNNLWKIVKQRYPLINKKEFEKWLISQSTYTLHKPARKRFKRSKIFVCNIDEQWQADLVDLKEFEKDNNGFQYLLTVIDVFSKFAWVEPLKNKGSIGVRNCFEKIFKARKPFFLQTDEGTEFYNRNVTDFLKKNNVKHFSSHNRDVKCAVVERFNRTLKNRMFRYFTFKNSRRYIDILQKLVNGYNETFHRSIKMKPIEVNEQNENFVFKNLYGFSSPLKYFDQKIEKRSNIQTTDYVRIPHVKETFAKGYYPNWTEEIFQIEKPVKKDNQILYKLKDFDGEEIKGTFYNKEVQQVVKPTAYKIEKIIRSRLKKGKREYFVKWLGYPDKFNSWIPSTDITSLRASQVE